jgi:hypothetical protein
MKHYLVIFTKNNGAKIIKDPEYVSMHRDDPDALFNPELPKGISPSLWVKDGNKISVKESDITTFVEAKGIDETFINTKITRLENEKIALNKHLNILDKKIKKYKIIIVSFGIIIAALVGKIACHL